MTSQELVPSKSHTSQDHHGDLRSRLQRASWDARLLRGWAVSLFCLSTFFKEVLVSFSCLTPVFVCKCNTDVLMTAYKRRLQICFQGGSAAGASEQQALGSSSISTMADVEEREEKEKKKGSTSFEREREREKEKRNKQKPGALVNLMALPVFLSPVNEQESMLTNENKTETPLHPFRFDQPRQAIIPCELTRHDHCVHDCLPRWERQFVNSISDVETGLKLFHSESTIDLPRRGKIRWQNVCSNNCSFALKEKSDGYDMVRHKSSKLKKHNEKSRNLLVERQLQKTRGVRTHWNACALPRLLVDLRYSMVTTR